jgi:hypothetical protein
MEMKIHDADLFNALATFGQSFQASNAFMKLLTTANNLFQYGITRSGDFIFGTSLMTDPLTQAAYSNSKKVSDFIPVVSSIMRLYEGAKHADIKGLHPTSTTYREAVANGALHSGLSSSVNSTKKLGSLQRMGLQSENTFGLSVEQDKKVVQQLALAARKVLNTGKEILDYAPERLEALPRLSEIKRQQDMHGGQPSILAYNNAVNNNIDFRTRGANVEGNVQAYLRIVPFLRAGTNVLYRLWQSRDVISENNLVKRKVLGANPLAESTANQNTRIKDNYLRQFKMATNVALPIAALAMLNWDDPRYQALDENQRKRYFHFWVGDQQFKIRKTDDIAQFANMIEHATVLMQHGDKSSYDQLKSALLTGLMEQLPGNLRSIGEDPKDTITQHLPYGASTWVNWQFNNGPGNSPIRDSQLDKLQGNSQYREGSTSPLAIATAKALGKNYSPTEIDHYGRGMLGPLYSYPADLSKALSPNFPSKGIDNIPVVRRFATDQKQELRRTDWQNRYHEYDTELQSLLGARRTVDVMGRRGQERDNVELQNLNPRSRVLLQMKDHFAEVDKKIGEYRAEQSKLFNDPRIPPERRQQLFDGYADAIAIEQYKIAVKIEQAIKEARQ